MLIDELKCLEVMINHVVTNSNLDSEILSQFENEETFNKHKNNLFNIISINKLLTYFNENPSFSLESFLKTGIVPNMYDEKSHTPIIDNFDGDYRTFYQLLINALKANNYFFDDDNNVYVSSANLEATIPQLWLYRLSQASKRDKYERVFFYNKNKTQRIKDKDSLLEYLRTTKTFIVELSTPNPNADYDIAFSSSEARVNSVLKNQREIKVDEIIDLFTEAVPDEYSVKTSKYRIGEEFWLIKKAERMGEAFYGEPLEIQEKYLNQWIVNRINCNAKAYEETQKYILLSNTDNSNRTLDREDTIVGLFNLYINIISSQEHDLSTISLSDFKIKSYMDESSQEEKSNRRNINVKIEEYKRRKNAATDEALHILDEIRSLDILTSMDIIGKKHQRYDILMDFISECEQKISSLEKRKSSFNNVESIAFDNEKIISLINEATKKGRVYIDGKDIVIELYNPAIGDPIFKATININKLLTFIENVNMSFEDYGSPKR